MTQMDIHSASINNDIETVKQLLSKDSTLACKKDEFDQSPLHYASAKGLLDIAKLLIQNGADPNHPGQRGMNALHLACNYNQFDIVKLFQQKLVTLDYDAVDEAGNSALHYASLNGSVRCVELLLNNGANINATNTKMATPIMMATLYWKTNMIDTLMTYKECNINHQDCRGDTALHWASRVGYSDVIRRLLSNGADKDITNLMEQKPWDIACEKLIATELE